MDAGRPKMDVIRIVLKKNLRQGWWTCQSCKIRSSKNFRIRYEECKRKRSKAHLDHAGVGGWDVRSKISVQ